MKKIKIVSIVMVCLFAITPFKSYATKEPKPLAVDKRLRVLTYDPNDVFKFTGFYGYESSIVFSGDESVESITMGDSLAWQIVPNSNRIFLKPIEQDATTNMTIITTKRVYHFELHAENAADINDPDMVFSVRFLYPEEGSSNSAVQQFSDAEDPVTPAVAENKNLNYNYTVSGPIEITPVKVFDDGLITYLEFKKTETELPSIFLVYDDNTESIINYKISGKYFVIERIAKRFTLRLGNLVGCIFNEKLLPQEKKPSDKKKPATIKNYK